MACESAAQAPLIDHSLPRSRVCSLRSCAECADGAMPAHADHHEIRALSAGDRSQCPDWPVFLENETVAARGYAGTRQVILEPLCGTLPPIRPKLRGRIDVGAGHASRSAASSSGSSRIHARRSLRGFPRSIGIWSAGLDSRKVSAESGLKDGETSSGGHGDLAKKDARTIAAAAERSSGAAHV